MRYELSATGEFACDCPDESVELENWTYDPPPQPCDRPRKTGPVKPTGEWVGEWVDDGPAEYSLEALAYIERTWRNEELVRADRCLNKVQDGASSVGTVSDWRKYRNELRDWPEHKSFPNKVFRPVAPDA